MNLHVKFVSAYSLKSLWVTRW